jgi:hypothetical protein
MPSPLIPSSLTPYFFRRRRDGETIVSFGERGPDFRFVERYMDFVKAAESTYFLFENTKKAGMSFDPTELEEALATRIT